MSRFSPFVAIIAILFCACDTPHGRPQRSEEALAPNEVLDFATLYSDNCAGCHGANGEGGAAMALANPVYLAVADDSAIRNVMANGVRGTSMPAFAESAGGLLTDKQIAVITQQIRARWSKPGFLADANPPAYTARSEGDLERGRVVYNAYCASCHGADGLGGPKGSAITNDSFLALISDQGLRTTVIAGRPELGAPDWRGNIPGKPMSDPEITNVVAWLVSKRVEVPGQPYSAANRHQENQQ